MKILPLLLIVTSTLLSSCRGMGQGPYKNYRISHDEAIPVCQMGGAPWNNR